MARSISEPIDFEPTVRVLASALAELEELGTRGGGAVDTRTRRDALAAYHRLGRPAAAFPPRWRHDYAALPFADLHWSTGRMRVPNLPAVQPRVTLDRESADVPALAVENAGGLAHLGSIYLEPQSRSGDPRPIFLSLGDAQHSHAASLNASYRRIVPYDTDRFTALSTAFQNCGAYIEVPGGVQLDAPLQLLWTSRPGETEAVFPHIVIRVGENARATVIERHVGGTDSLVCGIVEVDLAPRAQLDYVVLQQADEGTRLFFHRAARCAGAARIGWHGADLGGALARSAYQSHLAEAGAQADINAFFFAGGFRHVDLTVHVAHQAPETRSQTIVRSAASERGQGRFAGTIVVTPQARHSDASMRDDALILSRNAYLDAVPALEIATNDVSVSHAATVGTLDEEQLFYVQTRGLSRHQAERIVALAFFEPALARFPSEALRDEMRTALDAHLDDVPETFLT